MSSVLVGMFDTQAAATQARNALISGGFAPGAVAMTGGTTASTTATSSTAEPQEHEGAISRFFSSIFGDDTDDGAATGRAGGYADTYNEAFRRGSYGVSVTADSDAEMDKAERILNDGGAVDIDEQAESWRAQGWTGGSVGTVAAKLEDGDTRKLQEVEEELKVGKRAVAKGGVRIFSRMTEVPVSETVRLREEHANVQRRAVDRPATEADFAAFKEGSIEVRAMAEEAVVSKSARVTGEVEIGKTATEREETVHDTVRKTTVEVEQLDAGKGKVVPGSGTTSLSAASSSANRDPLTGEPGAHPVGVAVGATAGGLATGAAVGTVAGPIGTAVGAAVGAVAGAVAGKGVAESVDPTTGKKRV